MKTTKKEEHATQKKENKKVNKSKPKKEMKKEKVKIEQEEIRVEQPVKHIETKKSKKRLIRLHFSYNFRLTLSCILFMALLILGLNFMLRAFTIEETKGINYSEHSNLEYKVYLQPNDFYEVENLPKDMIYVANLIDKIKIDFNYKFLIEEPVDLIFDYEILGKLVIQDEFEENTYYEKVYTLLSSKKINLTDSTIENLNKTIEIDYGQYNEIANSFKSSYGLNTKSKLIVYFNIKKKIVEDNAVNMLINNSTNNMVINIPLSEKSVDINLVYHDINNESSVLDNTKVVIDNIIYLVVSMLCITTSLVFMIKSIRLVKYTIVKKTQYDKYIEKILNEYDRLIVETKTPPTRNEEDRENVIIVEKFTELLDVRDNLKQPIMYHVVAKHQKCQFYINSGEKIYLTTIKKVDIEAEYEKK
jgi:hypothetical protein